MCQKSQELLKDHAESKKSQEPQKNHAKSSKSAESHKFKPQHQNHENH